MCKHKIDKNNYLSAFSLIFDFAMINIIIKNTIGEARRRGDATWSIDKAEFLAFLGILIIRGATTASKFDLEMLWNKKWGLPIVSNTISPNRFCSIMRYLRFDDKSQRKENLKSDKFGMVSQLWNQLFENSQSVYIPEQNLTVDEQLLPCKVRCPFVIFMGSKPDKYGIKFWILCEVESNYILNGFPYLGKEEREEPLGKYVVMNLLKPYIRKGYNVTTDNFFTSKALAEELLKVDTTIVGTMRRSRKELPCLIQNLEKTMELYKTEAFEMSDKPVSLIVSKGKKKKVVPLLSTLHDDCKIIENAKKIPEAIAFYNTTKTGVDIMDAMTRKYTTKASTRRWPVTVFYNVLDISIINSWNLYKKCEASSITRQSFMLELGEQLCSLYKQAIQPKSPICASIPQPSSKRRNCQVSQHHNKTNTCCRSCGRLCCGVCTAKKETVATCIHCCEDKFMS